MHYYNDNLKYPHTENERIKTAVQWQTPDKDEYENGFLFQLHKSTDVEVVLDHVDLYTSGRYRCEISGEAPSFQTVSDHGDMLVVGKYHTLVVISNVKSHQQKFLPPNTFEKKRIK